MIYECCIIYVLFYFLFSVVYIFVSRDFLNDYYYAPIGSICVFFSLAICSLDVNYYINTMLVLW